MKAQNNFLEQLNKKREAAKAAEQAEKAAKPIERMTAEEKRWVALEKPTEEMTLAELQWISSGEASRTLMKEETNRPARHNFSELNKNRRKRWK